MPSPSNVAALVAVTFTMIACIRWVLPHFSTRGKCYFGMLTLWSVPYLIGQFAQEDKWGSLWVQYHLLDLCYAQLATLLGITTFTLYKNVRHQQYNSVILINWTGLVLVGATSFGFVSEVWDTLWSWCADTSLPNAIDANDYICITLGALITAAPLVIARRLEGCPARR